MRLAPIYALLAKRSQFLNVAADIQDFIDFSIEKLVRTDKVVVGLLTEAMLETYQLGFVVVSLGLVLYMPGNRNSLRNGAGPSPHYFNQKFFRTLILL